MNGRDYSLIFLLLLDYLDCKFHRLETLYTFCKMYKCPRTRGLCPLSFKTNNLQKLAATILEK